MKPIGVLAIYDLRVQQHSGMPKNKSISLRFPDAGNPGLSLAASSLIDFSSLISSIFIFELVDKKPYKSADEVIQINIQRPKSHPRKNNGETTKN